MGPDAMLLVGDQSVRKWENSALRSPSSGWPCGWSSRVSIQQTRPDWGPVPLPWFVSGSLPEIQHLPWIRGALLWQPAAWLGSRGICPFCVLNQLGTDTRNQIGFRSQNKSGKGPRLVQPDPACGCTRSGPLWGQPVPQFSIEHTCVSCWFLHVGHNLSSKVMSKAPFSQNRPPSSSFNYALLRCFSFSKNSTFLIENLENIKKKLKSPITPPLRDTHC